MNYGDPKPAAPPRRPLRSSASPQRTKAIVVSEATELFVSVTWHQGAEQPLGCGLEVAFLFTERPVNPSDPPNESRETLDCSDEPPPSGGAELTSFAEIHVTALNRARRWLTYWLLALVTYIVLISLPALVFDRLTAPEMREVGTVLLLPLLGLSYLAFRFFFRKRRGS